MTNKNRCKECRNCGLVFIENKRESNKQWGERLYCSIKCNNSSIDRFTCIFERLKSKQIKSDGCWGWRGSFDGGGYGQLSNRKGSAYSAEKAHRVSYEQHFGKIPEGLFVCHKCDNPACSNPDHLFLGTARDNIVDCSRKGRLNPKSLENLNRKKSLTRDEILEISSMKFVSRNGRGEGVKVKDIAKLYGVCNDLITDIKHNRYEA